MNRMYFHLFLAAVVGLFITQTGCDEESDRELFGQSNALSGQGVPENMVNIATGAPVFVSSTYSGDFAKENMVDGDLATAWGSAADSAAQWFFVDLGASQQIGGVGLFWTDKYFATHYDIGINNSEPLDHSQWTFVETVTAGAGGVEKFYQEVQARYVGVRLNEKNAFAYGVSEFEVYQDEPIGGNCENPHLVLDSPGDYFPYLMNGRFHDMDSIGAYQDGECGGAEQSERDVVYQIELAPGQTIDASAIIETRWVETEPNKWTAYYYDINLRLISDCSDGAQCLAAADETSNEPYIEQSPHGEKIYPILERLNYTNNTGAHQTVYLVVEGNSLENSSYFYDIAVSIQPEPEYLSNFKLTFYWTVTEEEDVKPKDTILGTCSGAPLATVDAQFAKDIKMEGSGRVLDPSSPSGYKTLNLGNCSCGTGYNCFVDVTSQSPWGVTSNGTSLLPYKTVAYDSRYLSSPTKWVYAPQLDGIEMPLLPGETTPRIHNGCLYLDDTGWSFGGRQIDLFATTIPAWKELDELMDDSIILYKGSVADCQN